LADLIAAKALPAFGAAVLPDLWVNFNPDGRNFVAAYHIDSQATLEKLLAAGGKRGQTSPIVKAVDTLFHEAEESGGRMGPESLSVLRAGLKLGPDAAFRRKVAKAIIDLGPDAAAALPELIDAFESPIGGRDY